MSNKPAKKEAGLQVKSYNMQDPKAMVTMAKVLKNHIAKHNLYTMIRGKAYVEVEGWQFAGGMMGIVPKVREVQDLGDGDKKYKWMATVDLIHIKTGEVVATGVAVCSNKESKKTSFDDYAVLSMAQTRAIGKAYRTCIAWVMKVAGYEATEAEGIDIDQEDGSVEEQSQDQVQEAVNKIGRMKSLKVLNTTEERLKQSQEFNDEDKKTIQDAINKRKKELG